MPKFLQHSKIVHAKTEGVYKVLREPDNRKLESSNEPFYEYQSISDDSIWLRSQSEMEDGRFYHLKGSDYIDVMTPMTRKKARLLEMRGAEQVGFIYQDRVDGRLAYVEGDAVRWLDADQRGAFMFPHGKNGIESPMKGKVIHDSRTDECSSCHKVELLVADTGKCFNCSVLMELPPPPPPAGPPCRAVNDDKKPEKRFRCKTCQDTGLVNGVCCHECQAFFGVY